MKVAFLTNIISPHQLPLAQEIINQVGIDNYEYLYTEPLHQERLSMGWEVNGKVRARECNFNDEALISSDVFLSGHRAISAFEARAKLHRQTLYMSERWFKPSLGALRLLFPRYLKMAWRIARLLHSDSFYYLPMGIHAARDMARLIMLLSGNIRTLWSSPVLAFESRPGGVVVPLQVAKQAGVLTHQMIAQAKRDGFIQIPESEWGKVKPCGICKQFRLWGYFVSPSSSDSDRSTTQVRNVLWVGRMLDWKCVSTLVQAVRELVAEGEPIVLTVIGNGPEEAKLKELAGSCNSIQFHSSVPIAKVRSYMQSHNTYVLPSNGYEGWGAVVSEALEEGMCVLGTYEAGASATILPPDHLFHAGDVAALKDLLRQPVKRLSIGTWSASSAAKALMELCHKD